MRLLKFDTVNPKNYLQKMAMQNSKAIGSMTRDELLEWIIKLRANFSDFYTYNMQCLGWEAEEFIIADVYLKKVEAELYRGRVSFENLKDRIIEIIRPVKDRRKLNLIRDYVNDFKPDVILVREQAGIPSEFWSSFSKNSLIVSRIAAPLPRAWSPASFDLILTSTEVYRKFFELNYITTYINPNGFDCRILDELETSEKRFDFTFVGGLGDRFWAERTKCFRYLADNSDIVWWGYNEETFAETDPIRKSHRGIAAGLEMLQIYKDSRIVFNDYGEVAGGEGVNQRIFEVMGVGSFLLTREADNLRKDFPVGLFATFRDEKDCLDKAKYYLSNEKEREEIALAAQAYILQNYNYRDIASDLDKIIREKYRKKFGKELL